MEYTKGEWIVGHKGWDGIPVVYVYQGTFPWVIFQSQHPPKDNGTQEANAEHIVLCVNSHDKLVEALKAFMVDYTNKSTVTIADHDLMLIIQQALAEAREG